MVGTMDKIKGGIKDVVGKITGDKRMQAEGKTDKAKGHVKDVARSVNSVKSGKDSAQRWPSDDVN
jgi:uncharacterized protein YjbJ (UPF0337 family)